jgi:two-component system LytT family sensor kinase
MGLPVDIKRFRFYLGIGFIYLIIWLIHNQISFQETFMPRFWNDCWRAFYVTVINFILFEYTIPRLSWNKVPESFLLIAGHVILYSFGLYAWREIGVQLQIYTELKKFSSVRQVIQWHFPYSISSVLFFAIIKHIYDYKNLRIATQQLRIEKQQAELNYLKSQTNPHFLFNTLNNIYALSRDKSDLAPESILRLSKILRFMLYETGGKYISIEQEIRIISDYIALERLRYDETLRVNFQYEVNELKKQLPPLLLMPLVENAFKHGVSETRKDPFLDIQLTLINDILRFEVKNSTGKSQTERVVKENIGLSNLRRQLELLYQDYNFAVEHQESVFCARLYINLASHV